MIPWITSGLGTRVGVRERAKKKVPTSNPVVEKCRVKSMNDPERNYRLRDVKDESACASHGKVTKWFSGFYGRSDRSERSDPIKVVFKGYIHAGCNFFNGVDG